eukprot:1932373-Alexandrium_andersonii.AAC.1
MSASLVGSEMCIRDSRPVASATSRGGRGGARAAGRWFFRRGASGPCMRCLLYTSDAADDM